MSVSYFLFFEGKAQNGVAKLHAAFRVHYEMILRRLPKVGTILLYSPAAYHDPMLQDDSGPVLLLRMTFALIEDLDAALRSKAAVLDFAKFSSQQGFKGRVRDDVLKSTQYPVESDPAGRAVSGPISYYVLYQGPAQDRREFIKYYEVNHPPLLGQLPGNHVTILYTPTDRPLPLGLVQAGHMLICDVSFDSSAALDSALASQVRRDLRADYEQFPKFEGPVKHQAMVKQVLKA